MIRKGLTIWLLVLVSYGSAGPRIKRKPLFFSQPSVSPYPYPVWNVQSYNSLQPVQSPHKENPTENETPSVDNFPDYPISEPEEPDEEDTYESGGLGSVLSLIPGGLSGLISLSSGSGRNEEETGEEDRTIDVGSGLIGLKKDILTTVLQKKKDLLTALKRDAIQLVIRKAKAKKAWIKNLLFGPPHPGYYYYYPKKSSILSYIPFGHWFGSSAHLSKVGLPYVPNLVAVKDPVIDLHGKHKFPYQSGTYLKVDYSGKDKLGLKPDVEYQVPGTSYGVPESPVSVPQLPYYENPPPFSQSPTASPEVAPEAYPYPPELPAAPQYNQPAHVEPVFPYPLSYAYSQESYPYASGDYYDTAQSEIQPVKERPVYTNFEGRKNEQGADNSLQNRLDEESTDDGSVYGDTTV